MKLIYHDIETNKIKILSSFHILLSFNWRTLKSVNFCEEGKSGMEIASILVKGNRFLKGKIFQIDINVNYFNETKEKKSSLDERSTKEKWLIKFQMTWIQQILWGILSNIVNNKIIFGWISAKQKLMVK